MRFATPALLVLLLGAWLILFATGRYIAAILVVGTGGIVWHGWRRVAGRFVRHS